MRKMGATLLGLCILVGAGCSDPDLVQVAKSLDATAITIWTLQTTVIEAESKQLISTNDTRTILTIALQVDQAGKEAVAITRTLSQLDPTNRAKLLTILTPVITSVNQLVGQGVGGITDPTTRQSIQTLLATLQTTLNVIQLTLAGGQ